MRTLPRRPNPCPLAALWLAVLLAAVSGATLAADEPGTADPPGLKRFEGAEIFFQSRADFDELKVALEKVEWDVSKAVVKPFRSTTVEGRRTTTYYRLPERVTTLEAFRGYRQELEEAGFEVVFAARGEELEVPSYNNQIAREVYRMVGNYGTPEEKAQWPFQHTDERQAAYVAARKTGPDGAETWAAVYIVPNTHANWLKIPEGVVLARVDLLEVEARRQRMELVESDEMAERIALDGRIALYGIEFDHDSAEVRASAEPTLAEIAKLLKERANLSILVVGHTDTQGSFDYNRKLSQRRADAVVARLIALGIAKERLFPVGVGFAAPVATNTTEEGRAKNRRVELVDLAGGRFP
jgi:outer membrane protein OmpA-like peptidoglycan-associated protein